MKRFYSYLGVLVILLVARFGLIVALEGAVSAGNALAQVNGGDAELARLRLFEGLKNMLDGVIFGVIVFAAIHHGRKWVKGLLAVALLSTCTGCIRSYDVPEYAEIGNQETGFLITIEGAADQAKLPSEEFLANHRIADKRIQITHRWNQTGRMSNSGEWIPNVRLIKVDRTPVTRVWTRDVATGTTAKNEAVSAETRDSVNFTCGFTCTACVQEADAVRFLYTYPAGSLAAVMDSEILSRIQRQVQEVANNYTADEIRARKGEILPAVEKDLVAFYKPRGITITNTALFGGLAFENKEIQKAIDDAAIAQNLKVVEQGRLEAQKKTNERLILEADGVAAKVKRDAEGSAAAKLIAATAEAESIRKVNEALEAAKGNPLAVQFRALDIQRIQAERWNGQLPPMLGGGAVPFINMGVGNATAK